MNDLLHNKTNILLMLKQAVRISKHFVDLSYVSIRKSRINDKTR